ncbi:hypothetical protein K9M59_00590 [Candidatus Gracilibacteria bacterium]|nr:hypothetical protein [Candidatus Gracilibacteria bacterium]MCF7819077.1 hypothetical protein [Candidatus Gracilibacteria bacterium]
MELALTWNLVILAVFIMLFAYNFLLGQNSTLKLILSLYIAVLTSDGIANILRQFIFDPSPGLRSLLGENYEQFFTGTRLILFLVAMVIFVVKGAFHISVEKHDHWALRTGIHAIFALLSSALFLATVLIYLSGNSFVEGMLFAKEITIYQESLLAQILIDYYQFWFSLPAIAFLVTSFLFDSRET